jgi:uncharacterized membrane protein YkoI
MRLSRFALTMVAMLLAAPAYTMTVTMKEERPGLLNKAKITAAAATATAQARVPKGKIVSAEIEEEGGKLLFSFDVRTKGKTGIDEVNVDATTGKVTNVQHESPKDEAAEKVADKKTK